MVSLIPIECEGVVSECGWTGFGPLKDTPGFFVQNGVRDDASR